MAVLFGSSASGGTDGDIDFKIFLRREPRNDERLITASFAREINSRYAFGYSKDPHNDVPYEIKTVSNYKLIKQAIDLAPFPLRDGKPIAVPIPKATNFLLTRECQMRITLSCFSTPSICLYGSGQRFAEYCDHAFSSVIRLVCATWDLTLDNVQGILQRLLHHPDGAEYKQYLGYRDSAEMRNWLLSKLAQKSKPQCVK